MTFPAPVMGALFLALALHAAQVFPASGVAALGGTEITGNFSILQAPKGALSPAQAWRMRHEFQPLNPPRNVSAYGQEAWLSSSIAPGQGDVLEIPGQLFNYVDVWYQLPGGEVVHDYSGVRYPYTERSIKHTNVAFPIPQATAGEIGVLIRMRNDTSHPMHFAAIVWPAENWHARLLNLRLWYGFYFGGIALLLIYNLFLALALRDVSYLFYIGYLSCLSFAVILCSGLGEEFLWPEGKPAYLILAASGLGSLFVVAFANSFLRVRQRHPLIARYSLLIGALAALLGIGSIFEFAVPGVPRPVTATFFHGLILASSLYFVAISVRSYLAGMQQARFLIVSMLTLFACMIVYWSYTYGYTPYNLYVGHFMEIGGIAEGVLLSLALSDRINILSAERRKAQRESIEYQRLFSRALISAQEQEKKALSEKMHDSVGHGMLVLINNLKRIAEKLAGPSPERRAEVEEQIENCSSIMNEIRGISHDLHPHMLSRLGLAAALESTIERAAASKSLEAQVEIGELNARPSEEVEIAVYRCVQECLNNILKYADATEIRFRLEQDRETLTAIVEDNGNGFDPAAAGSNGLGLSEIAGRASLLGGRFDIMSRPGQGTRVSLWLPIEAA